VNTTIPCPRNNSGNSCTKKINEANALRHVSIPEAGYRVIGGSLDTESNLPSLENISGKWFSQVRQGNSDNRESSGKGLF
jgi:hypothetical protein